MNLVTTEQEQTVFAAPVAVVLSRTEPSAGYLFAKRLFDIAASLLAGIVLLVPMLIIAMVVRLDSPGPALFLQERLGKNGKPFTMLKFRSMYLDAEVNGPQWAAVNDHRCTKVGRILRNSRLDELPQLWNILKGDMSFVGPRPERACFYDKFEEYIPGFRDRLQIKPGLTGWAQINGRDELPIDVKAAFDGEYVRKMSFLFDCKCFFGTIVSVLKHEGVVEGGTGQMEKEKKLP